MMNDECHALLFVGVPENLQEPDDRAGEETNLQALEMR